MCYTPIVSLTTAIIEWLLAALILVYYTKSRLGKYGAVLLILLGCYQFSEFMLCVSGQAELWGTIAFLSYTFLPAIGLHAVLAFHKKKVHPILLYSLPVIFSIVALVKKPFIVHGSCETMFVTILTYFSRSSQWIFYAAYYFGFIITAILLLIHKREKGARGKACLAMLIAFVIMFIPTLILIGIFPALYIKFPSVLCHFALLTSAAFFIALHYDNK